MAAERDHRDEPVYWFVILETAREQQDARLATEAKRELKRLGVNVTYRRQSSRGVANV